MDCLCLLRGQDNDLALVNGVGVHKTVGVALEDGLVLHQTGICQSNASRFPMGIEKPRALYICTSQSAHPTVSEETPLSRRAN